MIQRALLIALSLVAAVGLSARADVVHVRGREKPITGTVTKETADSVTVTPSGVKKKPEVIPSGDVLDIQYETVKPSTLNVLGGAFRDAKDSEKQSIDGATKEARRKALAVAIVKYLETLKKMDRVTQGQRYAARHFQYKVAVLTLKQAQIEQFPLDKAIQRLNEFKKDFPNSWQIHTVMPTLAQLHLEAGEYKEAQAVFEEMSVMPELPPAVRSEAELKVVRVLVKSGKVADAQTKLNALEKKAGTDKLFLSRVRMERASVLVSLKKIDAAIPILKQVVAENEDRTIKAIAHNTLGECLFKSEKYGEALWEFLWVDAVFNNEPAQQAKALYFLTKTFEKLGNGERAQECREMLLNGKRFTGTEYQRLMAAKTK
ncbi:MAG: hypothetical protein HYX68_27925 [Planctomycetes bacterium]|nr:hypothetical protein [Planctomycetota bacterium]